MNVKGPDLKESWFLEETLITTACHESVMSPGCHECVPCPTGSSESCLLEDLPGDSTWNWALWEQSVTLSQSSCVGLSWLWC